MDPQLPEPYRLLAEAEDLIRKEEEERAWSVCRRAMEMDVTDDRLQQRFGYIAATLGHLPEARAAMEAAVRIEPTDPSNWLGYGYVLAEMDEFEASLTALQRAVGDDRLQSACAQGLMGVSLGRLDRMEEAERAFREAERLARDDDVVLEEIRGRREGLGDWLLDRANLKLEQGLEDEAMRLAMRARAVSSSLENVYNFAIFARLCGRFDQALEALTECVRMSPSEADVWCAMGNLHRSLDDLETAREAYEHALVLDPLRVDVLNNLGLTLMELDDLDAAAHALDRGLALDASDADLHHNLGTVRALQGRPAEALESYTRALVAKPYDTDLLERTIAVLWELGRADEASSLERRLQKVADLRSSSPKGLEGPEDES